MQADTIASAAERAGKKVAQIDWVAGAAAPIAGPTVDFTNFFTNRGVLVGAADPVEQAGSAFFGVNYQVATLAAATGWTNVPAGDPDHAAAPKETTWSVTVWSGFAVLLEPEPQQATTSTSTTASRAAASPTTTSSSSPVGKTGASPSVDLAIGDFEAIACRAPTDSKAPEPARRPATT